MSILNSIIAYTQASSGGGTAGPGVPSKILLFHGSSVPVEYDTVTAALNAAVFGDIILLPPTAISEAFTITVGLNVLGFNAQTILDSKVTMSGGGLHGVAFMSPAGSEAIEWTGTAGNIGRIERVQFLGLGSGTCIKATGTTPLVLQDINLNHGTVDYVVDAEAGTDVRMNRVVSHPAAVVNNESYRFAGNVTAKCSTASAASPGHQWRFTGNAVGTLIGCAAYNASNQGFRLEDNADVVLNGATVDDTCFMSVAVAGASSARLKVLNSLLYCYSGYDIGLDWNEVNTEINVANTIYSQHWGPETFYSSARWQDNHTSTDSGHEGLVVEQNLIVGAHYKEASVYFGEGAPYNTHMTVLHQDATGFYTNKTTEALTYNVPWTPFSNANGEYLYIGNDHTFTALELEIVTKLSKDTIVAEYWDGSSWVTFPTMSTRAVGPLSFTDETPWTNTGKQNCRFGDMFVDSATLPVPMWNTWQQSTIEEITKYWMRFGITDAGAGSGSIKNLNLWGNAGKLSGGGIEFFGNMIHWKQVSEWSLLNLKEINGATPSRTDVRLAQNIRLNNMWTLSNGAYDALGGLVDLPSWIDQSRAMYMTVGWSVSNNGTGNVEITNYSTLVEPGDIFNDTIPSTKTVTYTAIDGTDEKSYSQLIYGMIYGAGSRGQLALTVGRNGPVAEDTYGGNCRLNSTTLYAQVWKA